MPFEPVGADENNRLAALRALKIVGTPRSAGFDAVSRLAAEMFACPIAFVSLIEKDRQWFKAECGLGVDSTPRDAALCNYTILNSDVLVVEDAAADLRFSSSPLVTTSPGIRFYAGVPITVEGGYRIGALCIADRKPRTFSAADTEKLRQFGHVVEELVAAFAHEVRAEAAAEKAAANAHELWKRTRLLEQVERMAHAGGWELDLKTKMVQWSDEVYRIHDLKPGEEFDFKEALNFYPRDWRPIVTANVESTIATGVPFSFEADFVSALGRKKWVRAAGECEMQDGVPVRLFGMFQDISEEKAARDRLWHVANFDELTGLANRRHLNEMLAASIRRGEGAALIILDLDNFKLINDTRGHALGDRILSETAQRLASLIPRQSVLARIGGDEFAVLLPGSPSKERVKRTGQAILAHIAKPIRLDANVFHLAATAGSARYPDDAATGDELLKMAEIALFKAKKTERGSLRVYSASFGRLVEQRTQSILLVREAIANYRLVAYYQPKVRLDDGALFGFEALMRIVNEDGAILTPADFGSALEDRETERAVGRRMLEAVTADLADWYHAGLDAGSVSINVGAADFADSKLAERILARLANLALPPSALTIEVTESVFLGEGEAVVRDALDKLDAAGVTIELDDFGTGYASLTHLRDFPIRRLKIDRSFIAAMHRDEGSHAIVRAVIELGHNLDCEIIAEGIEREEQETELRRLGCDYGQGYLFGSPECAQATKRSIADGAKAALKRISETAAAIRVGKTAKAVGAKSGKRVAAAGGRNSR